MKNVNLWDEILKPIVVLGVICLVCSLLLAVTNNITAPIIAQKAEEKANEAYKVVLPDADSFTTLEGVAIEGVTKALKANNDTGYVFSAEVNGYAGPVPVVVAISNEGKIINVQFLENTETAGLGQKVREEWFGAQYKDRDASEITLDSIDTVSGATISSKAGNDAVNLAINAFNIVKEGA